MVRTRIEVVLAVDHDSVITDKELQDACANTLPGITLVERLRPGAPRERDSAVIDDVEKASGGR